MTRLVDDLLDVARFTQSKIEIRKTVLDLRDIIPDVLEEVRLGFDEAGLELVHEPPQTALWVIGDPIRLQQVQVNLLRNAAKYTPRGGRVWYSLGREGEHVVIRVRDTGVGLTAEMKRRVFDPFVQADETLDRAGGGIGLGLTLVKSITELHGGTVEAQSEGTSRGSEFIVRLPLEHSPSPSDGDATAEEVQEGNRPTRPAERKKPRILLVEDDADIRTSLVGILELEGYQIRNASDGQTALTILAAERFDVALLDIGLPGMDGYRLAREIRARFPTSPFLVALTGYGRPEDRAKAVKAGFDRHLTKPYRPAELMSILESVPASGTEGPPFHDKDGVARSERSQKT
jgi:CheY-like chemotaxis protein